MWEGKQGYQALSIFLMHSGHPGQSGGSTGGWGPWFVESQALRVPGSQCGESKELMKMLGKTLLCIRLRIKFQKPQFSSVQFSRSVVSDSLRPNESQHARPPCPSPTPEFTQTHVHRVSDAIQPPHPLSSPSPPAPNPSQHQSLFQ